MPLPKYEPTSDDSYDRKIAARKLESDWEETSAKLEKVDPLFATVANRHRALSGYGQAAVWLSMLGVITGAAIPNTVTIWCAAIVGFSGAVLLAVSYARYERARKHSFFIYVEAKHALEQKRTRA